jgi:hypothetical protein
MLDTIAMNFASKATQRHANSARPHASVRSHDALGVAGPSRTARCPVAEQARKVSSLTDLIEPVLTIGSCGTGQWARQVRTP